MYTHSAYTQFDDICDSYHNYDDQNYYSNHSHVSHYDRNVTPRATIWNGEDAYLQDSQYRSQYDQEYDQEYNNNVASSWPDSHRPENRWNRQWPEDSSRPSIGHRPNRQLRGDFDLELQLPKDCGFDLRLPEDIPRTNLRSQFDRHPERGFPELDIEHPFGRHLREDFDVGLELDEDYFRGPRVERQRYDSSKLDTENHFDSYPREESPRLGSTYQDDPRLGGFWRPRRL